MNELSDLTSSISKAWKHPYKRFLMINYIGITIALLLSVLFKNYMITASIAVTFIWNALMWNVLTRNTKD